MKYLLDTDTCIELIRRKPAGLLQRLVEVEPGEAGISSITRAELIYGVAKSTRPEENQAALEQFLLPLELVDFNDSAALAYGQIRAALERLGQGIGGMDLLIAAHALSLGCILVTNNVKEFSHVEGLKIENWLSRQA